MNRKCTHAVVVVLCVYWILYHQCYAHVCGYIKPLPHIHTHAYRWKQTPIWCLVFKTRYLIGSTRQRRPPFMKPWYVCVWFVFAHVCVSKSVCVRVCAVVVCQRRNYNVTTHTHTHARAHTVACEEGSQNSSTWNGDWTFAQSLEGCPSEGVAWTQRYRSFVFLHTHTHTQKKSKNKKHFFSPHNAIRMLLTFNILVFIILQHT